MPLYVTIKNLNVQEMNKQVIVRHNPCPQSDFIHVPKKNRKLERIGMKSYLLVQRKFACSWCTQIDLRVILVSSVSFHAANQKI